MMEDLGCEVVGPHVQSFDYLVDEGLSLIPKTVPPERFKVNDLCIELRVESVTLLPPSGPDANSSRIYPNECRQRGITYSGRLDADLRVNVNGTCVEECKVNVGEVPVMLQSKACHLRGLTQKQLYKIGEEPHEMGGYYVVNGTEKVIRTLAVMRRNYPVALVRERFESRGKMFTKYAVVMRCVANNCKAITLTFHYLENTSICVSFRFSREVFFVPLMYILKASCDLSDKRIFKILLRGREHDAFWRTSVLNMMQNALADSVLTKDDALKRLGTAFRSSMADRIAPWDTDQQVGIFLLEQCIFPQLSKGIDKFYAGVYTAQKLITLVRNEIGPESPDSVQFQEAAMSGHIVLHFLRGRIEVYLQKLRAKVEMDCRMAKDSFDMDEFRESFWKTVRRPQFAAEMVTRPIISFLATGNVPLNMDVGAGQKSGLAVIAERINYLRFASHFRAIHRGSSFQEMRSTEVRKLKPEAWGFICPVHTPDGAPCGLLNHLTASCRILAHTLDTSKMVPFLMNHGVMSHAAVELNWPSQTDPKQTTRHFPFPVLVDGNFIGYVFGKTKAHKLCSELRAAKVDVNNNDVPTLIEIAFVDCSPNVQQVQTQMPGVFVFTESSRLLRPVFYLPSKAVDFIGTFEQIYLSICIIPEEATAGLTQHQEISQDALFSYMAVLIPYPDHNQSPRNVYQCQMAKQTMGVPLYSWKYRADHKMYRLLTPQSPIVSTDSYKKYNIDDHPLGTNAIVAVISYTGYDMEDAMSINKASFERGIAYGHLIKVERLDLTEKGQAKESRVFQLDPSKHSLLKSIDWEGLPIVGMLYTEGIPYLCKRNLQDSTYAVEKFKGAEAAYCENVRVIRNDSTPTHLTHALISWRVCRNPCIGDKFASRHGQKGICSFLWPAEDMPFTDSGLVPDILFNPHGYPSRMTIGMMIESMAGKSAALHGIRQNATPFVFSEQQPAIEFYGRQLKAAGYNHHGTEMMYSGVDGRAMQCEIFIGVVYYQRLRHMVSDKYQCRASGPVDPSTHQPIKGRKRGGGVRFGEMERDSLIAHGVAACLQDRLFFSSDQDVAYVCNKCGSILSIAECSPATLVNNNILKPKGDEGSSTAPRPFCLVCRSFADINMVSIPHVWRFLTAEFASVGIRTVLKYSPKKAMN